MSSLSTIHPQGPSPGRPDLRLAVPAGAEHVARVRHAVEALADRAGVDADRRGDVTLAVGEACANAVMHAYEGQDPGTLEVVGRLVGRRLEVAITDRGGGMAPRTDSPGLGLGLPLMASLTSALELRAVEGGGTEVWMAFDLGRANSARQPLRRVG